MLGGQLRRATLSTSRGKWGHLISPAVHKALVKYGLPADGSSIRPDMRTGPSGIILKSDVVRASKASTKGTGTATAVTSPSPKGGPAGGKRVIMTPGRGPERGAFDSVALDPAVRKAAVDAARAKLSVPQGTVAVRCDAAAALKAVSDSGDPRVTLTHVVIRAAALAVRSVPEANAWVSEDGHVTPCGHVTASLSAGSLGSAPITVHSPDALGLSAIAAQCHAVSSAENGSGAGIGGAAATIAVVDMGGAGVGGFSPFVAPPAACAFGVSAPMREAAVGTDGRPVARTVVEVSIAHDARAVDDAAAARLARAFRSIIERGFF